MTTPAEYLVLARKYRPQRFGEMSGQAHVVRTLSNAFRTGQIAHAFLFTGPRGVGKTTTARLVAKALNCVEGPTAEPCGVCVPCTEIAEGRSVDVSEIDAASNNGVDNVRDIVEGVKYRPARDRFKVFVVDEVHMLSTGAFNALLKTLEEPPPHVKFVLATTDVHKVPETIVSRCQRFDFRRLTVAEIVLQLKKVAEKEGMRMSPGALATLARSAEGGMRDALSMLDQVRASCGDAPDDADVAEALGTVDGAAISRIGAALLARDGAAVLKEIEVLYERGLEMKRVAEELARHLRNVLVARLVPSSPIDLPDAEVAEVRAQAQCGDPAQLTRLFDLAQRAVNDVKLSEGSRHALEVALLEGVFLAPGTDVAELIKRLDTLSGGAPPGPPPRSGGAGEGPPPTPPATQRGSSVPPATSPPPGFRPLQSSSRAEVVKGEPFKDTSPVSLGRSTEGPEGLSAEQEQWREAVAAVEQVSPMTGPALKQAVLLRLVEGEVAVRLPAGIFAQTAEKRRGEIEAELSRFFARPTRLEISVSTSSLPPSAAPVKGGPASIAEVEAAERQARSSSVREAAKTNENIREAARILGATVEKIEDAEPMDIQYLMKQAKKLEKAMAVAKEELSSLSVEAESGEGLVRVVMNGRCEITKLTIDEKALTSDDKGMLEDLVTAAVNSAAQKAHLVADEHLEKASGGFRIPGLG